MMPYKRPRGAFPHRASMTRRASFGLYVMTTTTALLGGCGRFERPQSPSAEVPSAIISTLPGEVEHSTKPFMDREDVVVICPEELAQKQPHPGRQTITVEVVYAPGTIQDASIQVSYEPMLLDDRFADRRVDPLRAARDNSILRSDQPGIVPTTFIKKSGVLPEYRLRTASGSFDLWWRVVYTAEIPVLRGQKHILLSSNSRTYKEALSPLRPDDGKPSDTLFASVAVTPEKPVQLAGTKVHYPVKDGDILEVSPESNEGRILGKSAAYKEIEIFAMNDKGQLVSSTGVISPDTGAKVLITRYSERDPFTENTLEGTPCSVTKTLATCSTRLIYGIKVP